MPTLCGHCIHMVRLSPHILLTMESWNLTHSNYTSLPSNLEETQGPSHTLAIAYLSSMVLRRVLRTRSRD